jgi:outer membrane protein assembly factor BamB
MTILEQLRSAAPAASLALSALLAVSPAGRAQSAGPASGAWPQWGGPDRNFIVQASGLAASWPEGGPPRIWERPLGLGHSAIVSDGERLYTMYRPGKEISRRGPWESRERVVALEAATGKTIWEYEYESEPMHFSFGAGPHATPLIAGDFVFTVGTNKQLHAFDKGTGKIVWSHDLVQAFGATPALLRPAVKAGFASSPLAYGDSIILQVGGPGQAVMAFRQKDGTVAWKGGDFNNAEAAPILIDVGGEPQLVVFGGQSVNGLDPRSGRVLWSFPHDTDGDMNNSMPVWGPDNILFITSAYNQGSRGLRITKDGGETKVEELWFTNRFRLMFSNALLLGEYVYGTSGDFGPAFLGALDIRTGKLAWQERGFGRSSLVHTGDATIILDEDGDLALTQLTPDGVKVLAEANIFGGTSWTAPTLVGTTLYARNREVIVALDLARR